MPRSVEANINPALLVWARKNAGYEIEAAAKKVPTSPARLESWELSKGRPTIIQLRKLGNVYKRPIAIFYLSDPPKDFQPIHDYRRFPGTLSEAQSPELRFEIRKAYSRREIALELFRELEVTPKKFILQLALRDDPEEKAVQIRSTLKLKYEEQIQRRPGYEAFNFWRAALENIHILVLQATDVNSLEIRGFSISESSAPVIVVNISDSPQARTFTMLHELCHIMLREGGLCDLDEGARKRPEEQKVEIFCNRVAGATLVPRDYLLQEDIVKTKVKNASWTDGEIRHLADRYGVSRDVLLRRMLLCDLISNNFYENKFDQLQKEYAQKKEDYEKKKLAGEISGFAPPHRLAMSSAGTLFLHLVLNSYHHNKITVSDVSDYLGIRLKHLERIEQEAGSVQRREGIRF